MHNIFWKGYTSNERHAAITDIQNIISKYGDIVDFNLFSDISLSLKIEVKESQIDRLYSELKQTMGMDGFDSLNSVSETERTIYLSITFIKGTGDLRIETPAVPG